MLTCCLLIPSMTHYSFTAIVTYHVTPFPFYLGHRPLWKDTLSAWVAAPVPMHPALLSLLQFGVHPTSLPSGLGHCLFHTFIYCFTQLYGYFVKEFCIYVRSWQILLKNYIVNIVDLWTTYFLWHLQLFNSAMAEEWTWLCSNNTQSQTIGSYTVVC